VTTGADPARPLWGRRATERLWRARWGLLRNAALVVFALVAVGIPVWIVLVNSAKSIGEANQLGLSLPSEWRVFENFSTVLDQGRAGIGLRNTLLVTIPSVAGIVILGGFASWVFARSKSRSVSLLYFLTISGILIPPAVVTSIQVLKVLTLQGTLPALIVFYMGIFMSFGVFLVTGFVKTIPIELEEAARIDGAGSFTVFTRIIAPLLSPVLLTTSFILVVFIWNDFFYPFFILRGNDQRTLTLGLFNFVSGYQYQIRWNLVFADVVLVSLPLIGLFALLQRRIVAGLLGASVNK
jgi:raffinose/stachyose/melibiose transport system permease protein